MCVDTPTGPTQIQVSKSDGTLISGKLTTGLSRPDVDAAYLGYPNGDKSGFTFDATQLSDGAQTIRVKVTSSSSATLTWNIRVNIDNTLKM